MIKDLNQNVQIFFLMTLANALNHQVNLTAKYWQNFFAKL